MFIRISCRGVSNSAALSANNVLMILHCAFCVVDCAPQVGNHAAGKVDVKLIPQLVELVLECFCWPGELPSYYRDLHARPLGLLLTWMLLVRRILKWTEASHSSWMWSVMLLWHIWLLLMVSTGVPRFLARQLSVPSSWFSANYTCLVAIVRILAGQITAEIGSRCANISCYTLLLVNQKSFSPCNVLCGNCTVSEWYILGAESFRSWLLWGESTCWLLEFPC